MEESEAEAMKLKYASAYTDNNEIDPTLKYPIDPDRQVESRRFIEIVEGRMEEIIENVRYQIPDDYYGKMLGGIILTGGGANMKNIEKAFINSTRIEKVRVAKFVTATINSSNDLIKAKNGMYNTVLGLLIKGDMNCAGGPIDLSGNLFGDEEKPQPAINDRKARQPHETDKGVILTEQEEQRAREEAQRKKEEEERIRREEEEKAREEARRKKKQNNWLNRTVRALKQFGSEIVSDE
jgi:cell division protein FtsA